MVPGGGGHQRAQHQNDHHGNLAAHITKDPQHTAPLVKEGEPSAGGVGPALIVQRPGLGNLVAAALVGQDQSHQSNQGDHQPHAQKYRPARAPEGV